jgi:RNA polymerase sigma factor (sigma-70 family)
MGDIASERGDQINRDYWSYLKTLDERDAAKLYERIFKVSGDVDKVISSAVRGFLRVYPETSSSDIFQRLSLTPKDPSALMANDARRFAEAISRDEYRKHRESIILHAKGLIPREAVNPWPVPVRAIVRIAQNCCAKSLGDENPGMARVRRNFNDYINKSRESGKTPFVIMRPNDFFGRPSEREVIGLAVWQQEENSAGRGRVRELVERPGEVIKRKEFETWHGSGKRSMESLIAATLAYCGTGVSRPDLWRFIKHCYQLDLMDWDELEKKMDVRTGVEYQVIGDTAHDLYDQLKPEQRKVLQLRHFENLSFKAIGAELGISDKTADGIYRGAVNALRKAAERKGINSGSSAGASRGEEQNNDEHIRR